MKIYKLADNTIDNKDYDKMISFLKQRKYLNQSKVTKKFEKNFSNFLRTKYSVFVNSGSSANLLIAQTLLEGNFLKNKILTPKFIIIKQNINSNPNNIFKFVNKKLNKRNYVIDGVIEKPSVKKAPSNKAVIGRYILPREIFSKLLKQKPGKGGEIHITDAIQTLIQNDKKFIAHNFSGKYLDCGSMSGYIKSTLEIAKS